MLHLSEGSIDFYNNQEKIQHEKIYLNTSFCAPYVEVVEEMTLPEFFHFHNQFKPFIPNIDVKQIIETIDLRQSAQKQIRYYSSGMKQRVRLAQAIFSNTAILLLDEPCSNLDNAGIELYYSLIRNYCRDRIVIVSSNEELEYKFCDKKISMADYK
jgi:ABC-type multidrug transport system ATPase subunit